jgi:hypothetical protein
MTAQRLIGNALIVLSAIEALAFVAMYSVVARWWRSEVGRNIMALMGVIAAVLVLSTIRIIFGDNSWFAWLRLGVFAGVPVVLARRLWLLWRVQVRDRLVARE